MDSQHPPLDTLRDIKRMMERSSRFISLSGWSGISAGLSALVGAWVAHNRIEHYHANKVDMSVSKGYRIALGDNARILLADLIWIAAITLVVALVTAFLFTYLRSRKNQTPIWDRTVQRLAWNTLMPMAVGGLLIIRAMQWGYFELVAPGCLIFYGLALVNASKYTLGEVRYLGYGQLVLGIINMWVVGEERCSVETGLYFWAAGFGVLHIIYGALMWWKYERRPGQ